MLPRTADLIRPEDVPTEVWRQALSEAWSHEPKVRVLRAEIDAGQSLDVQQAWDDFQACLQDTFRSALIGLGHHRRAGRRVEPKGRVARVSMESQTCRGPRQEHGVMRHRKMRRQIARLYDLAQCADKVAEGTAGSQMVLNLQALRQRCGNLTAGQARAEARTLQNLLHAEEEREKGRRLRDWRTKVSTDTAALSRWLEAKADPAAESLLDETGRHTETAAQAADSIARYWQAFWRDLDIQRPAFHGRNAAVMEGVEVPQQEAVLPLPTGEELGARARKATGAGGADGWHSSELRHLPDGAFELFADLIRGWANEGRVPLQIQQSRMVCIPKPGRRVDNSSVGVGDVRPITSCWWRLFAGTFYNSVQFKQWRRKTCPRKSEPSRVKIATSFWPASCMNSQRGSISWLWTLPKPSTRWMWRSPSKSFGGCGGRLA